MTKIVIRHHLRRRPHETAAKPEVNVKEHERTIEGIIAPLERRAQDFPRTAHARAVDKGIEAKTVLPLTEKNIAKWRGSPSTIDLKGIDTPDLVRRAKEIHEKAAKAKVACKSCEAKLGKRKEAFKLQEARAPGKPRAALGWEPGQREAPAFHKLGRLEREGLLKLADARGLDRRVIDWGALVDSTLTYDENKTLISEFLGHGEKYQSARKLQDEYEGQLQSYLKELAYRSENAKTESERQLAKTELSVLAEVTA